MLVRNLTAWLPFPSNSHRFPEHDLGTFLECDFVSRTAQRPAHLMVKVRYPDKDCTAVYWNASESLLLRLMTTLQALEGIPMEQIGEAELLELKPLT